MVVINCQGETKHLVYQKIPHSFLIILLTRLIEVVLSRQTDNFQLYKLTATTADTTPVMAALLTQKVIKLLHDLIEN